MILSFKQLIFIDRRIARWTRCACWGERTLLLHLLD